MPNVEDGAGTVVPATIVTERLLLRPWRADDAAELLEILESNRDHLGPWIPARVADPAPVPALRERLAGFTDEFMRNREWRYGIFARDDRRILGELDLFPRSDAGRVPFADADRAELGYWIRRDAAGQGLVTEATRAVLDVAIALNRFGKFEIRCDARNAPSAAIPRRLGFALESTVASRSVRAGEPGVELQIWTWTPDERSMMGDAAR